MATQQIDLGVSYRDLSKRLEQIVRADVRAPQEVIEDACQFAWSRLLHQSERVRGDRRLAWLARTAVREALKLLGRERRELSLEAELGVRAALAACGPLPDERFEQRERLALVRRLPERQQRMLWLHALGLRYDEIAAHDKCTARTVERQLLRAKHAVRVADAE